MYGGWRAHYHLAMEPWTGHPMQLDRAIEEGTASLLAPGETREANVAFVLYAGLSAVEGVRSSGELFEVV